MRIAVAALVVLGLAACSEGVETLDATGRDAGPVDLGFSGGEDFGIGGDADGGSGRPDLGGADADAGGAADVDAGGAADADGGGGAPDADGGGGAPDADGGGIDPNKDAGDDGDADVGAGRADADGGGGDADAGAGDAGVACAFGTGPALQIVVTSLDGGAPARVEGLATTSTTPSFEVHFVTGPTLRFGTPPPFRVPAGPVYVAAQVSRPFWSEHSVVFREVAPNGGAGALIGATWQVTNLTSPPQVSFPVPPEVPGARLTYRAEMCAATATDPCRTPVITQALEVADVATGATIVLGTQRDGVVGAFRAANGRSYAYVGRPGCTDTPMAWYRGWIAPR